MAWLTYQFWGSHDGVSWRDVTDLAPHPTWTIADAVKWARQEVEVMSRLDRYPYLRLQRRQGSYRPRGDWRVLFSWKFGEPQSVDAVARTAGRVTG